MCYLSLFPILIMTIFAVSLKILSYISNSSTLFDHINESWSPYHAVHSFLSHAAAALLTKQLWFQTNVPNCLCSLVQVHTQVTACVIWGVRLEQLVGVWGGFFFCGNILRWLNSPWLRIFCGWIHWEVITGAFWKYKSGSISMQTVGLEALPSSLYPCPHCTTSDFINQEGSQKCWPSSWLAQGTWCDWDTTGLPQPGSQGLLVPTPTPTSCLTPKTQPASPHPSLPALRGPKSQGSD